MTRSVSMRTLPAVLAVLAVLAGCATNPVPESRSVPAPLAKIEAGAEDAYDSAIAENFTGVTSEANQLARTWKAFRSRALADGVSASDANALEKSILALKEAGAKAKGKVIVGRAANAVSGPVALLYGVYEPTVPAVLVELDFLGREVALDGMAADLRRASADIGRVAAVWKTLRPEVVSMGPNEAASFDDSIARERRAVRSRDAGALVITANAQLEIVDGIEMLYAGKPRSI
jgi:hypothetical protein